MNVKFLRKLAARVAWSRPPNVIVGGDYMRRWHVIRRNPFFNVYLHHFLKSDRDFALHDHPWWNVSILLRGCYIEVTHVNGTEHRALYRMGAVKFRLAKFAHRVELVGDRPCWTLFITGPRLRTWGFYCPKGWVPWHTSKGRGKNGICD